MSLTPSRQRNAVSEGMALGLIMCGRTEMTWDDKIGVDLSFEGAWKSWAYRDRFPQVSTDLHRGSDGVWVMTHADRQKQVWTLYWEMDGNRLVIHPRSGDWDLDPDDTARVIGGDVPAAGWRDLANDFLTRLG